MTLTIRQALSLLLLVTFGLGAAVVYWKGGVKPRQAAKEARTEVKALVRSTAVSTATAARVDTQAHDTRQTTQAAQDKIRDLARRPSTPDAPYEPARPLDHATRIGRAHPDVLLIAREAYERAIQAACRVQRTSDCPASTPASR